MMESCCGWVGLNSEVLEVVQRSGLGERLGRERMLFTLEQAVERYLTINKLTEERTPLI